MAKLNDSHFDPARTAVPSKDTSPNVQQRKDTCGDCRAELYHGDCPACDPWPEDEFDYDIFDYQH